METKPSCKAPFKMEEKKGTSCARPIVIEDSPLRFPRIVLIIKVTRAAEYRFVELISDTNLGVN